MGDFDEYDYLEKAVEGTETRKDKDRKSSRHHDKDANGEKREDRARSDRRDKEKDRDQRRDREKDRDGEREREREKEKERDHRSRDRDYKERDRDREKEKVRDREKEKEREREKERESSRRSSSRSRLDREAEREMERARSRERALREREMEREMRERESRRFKEKKEAGEPEADPERDQRTVFAYQMPLKATERDVYEFFSKAGKVRDVRLIMDRNSRRSKGVGYIEFYDSMSVPMAIALSGQLLFGQPVMVKPSEAEKNLVQSTSTGGSGLLGAGAAKKIYVGNLHFNITEDQLRQELSTYRCNSVFCKIDSFQLHHSIPQVFEPFGPVELVQLPVDMETGQCKGYGFIQFAQIEHAKAAQSLNGKLDIAGRVIKVSAVTDHVPVQETGTHAADFDDDDGGGLSLNARSRAMLMQKLDRTGTASSIAESLGVAPANQQQLSLPVNGQAAVAAALLTSPFTMPMAAPIGEPSECVLLTNMFDPRTETEPDFDLDIKEDVHEECSKFGLVKHIYVDKHSSGHVYLRFDTVAAAASCQRTMHMRFFAGNRISATFMRPQEYDAKFASGA